MKRLTKYLLFAVLAVPTIALAGGISLKSSRVINDEVNLALQKFYKEVPGGKKFLEKTKGYLVFPSVIKAGFGVGGEFGEGALVEDGKITAYYNTASASVGLQLGVQKKSVIIAFLSEDALAKFKNSDGYTVGVDGSVALAIWGTGKDISNLTIKKPIIAFVYGNQGLMYNLTIEGSKITRIYPE